MVCPPVDNKHHDENDEPSSVRAGTTADILPIEYYSHEQRTDDLRRPVQHAVEGTRADVEEGPCSASIM